MMMMPLNRDYERIINYQRCMIMNINMSILSV
jgi:hypothetical protein